MKMRLAALMAALLLLVLACAQTACAADTLTLPAGTREIGQEAFAGCGASVIRALPGLKKIGSRAFANCPSLREIILPPGVETIASDAFDGCSARVKINTSGWTKDNRWKKTIYNLDWFDHRDCFYNNSSFMGFRRKDNIVLTDVDTGRSFTAKIQWSSGNHVDVEPRTKYDTAVLCSLYGVSDAQELVTKDKYKRRAVVVTSVNGKYQAIGSIYAIPHGDDTVSGNDFDGQFCLHFKNSKTHGTGVVDTSSGGHQEMIAAAQTYLSRKTTADGTKITVSSSCPD